MIDTQNSQFNRMLLIILVVLFLLTLAGFSYFNWVAESGNMQWWMMLLNIPIISIPMLLLYGSIYVLVVGWREHSRSGEVSSRLAKIIHWAPRVAAILIIFFVSLFSLDVFETQAPPLELLAGFLIHNIPSIAMIILLIFAWKRPVVGFVAFLTVAIVLALFFVRDIEALPTLLLIIFPILMVAMLFYADWKWREPKPTMEEQIS